MPKLDADLIVINAAELVTLRDGDLPRRGKAMRELSVVKGGAVALRDGDIAGVGTTAQILDQFRAARTIDAVGKVVMPGFVDPHTHLVFAGSREAEFEMRIEGRSYMDIARAGGGINSSVKTFREASHDELLRAARKRADRFLRAGTTTIEIKSGYGLRLEDELKALGVAQALGREHAVDVVTTFLGAHEVPPEYRDRHDEYVKLVTETMLPEVAKSGLAEFCDIFCEKGVFEIEDSRRILSAAKALGLKLKLHADEIATLGGAELAVELGARSADHLMAISDAGIAALAASDTIATLLPATSFSLGLHGYAPARRLIDAGAAVALSTDCNPGSSMTESVPFVINLAAAYLRMTAAEALTACTVNAACAIDRQHRIGRLQPGLQADIIVLNIPNVQYLPYHVALDCVDTVIKRGNVVVEKHLPPL